MTEQAPCLDQLTGPVVCLGECMVEFRRDGDCWRQGFAGDSLNVAWALRALATDRQVDYATMIGTDAVSDDLLRFIAAAGIGTGRIGRDPARSVGLYTISTDTRGERSFGYWRSASAARQLAAQPGAIRDRLAGAGLVYLSGISAAILGPEGRANLLDDLAALAARGTLIAYDPNYRPLLWEGASDMADFTRRVAGLSHLVLPTFEDEQAAFGDPGPQATLARLRDWGAAEVVVKNGPLPALVAQGATLVEMPPPATLHPVDTTGAGDAFNGAYLAARLSGSTPGAAARLAHRVTGIVVMTPGALVPADHLRACLTG